MAQPLPPLAGQLRVTQLWGNDVIDEKVAMNGFASVGTTGGATFTIPPAGLPEPHMLFAHTDVGLVVNLHEGMGGHLVLGGRTQQVTDLLGAGTRQRSVLLNPNDTGLIELCGGEHRFFFQFGAAVPLVDWDLPADFPAVMGGFGYSAFLHICLIVLIFLFWVPDRGGRKGVMATILGPGNNTKPKVEEVIEIKPEEEAAGAEDAEDAPPASTAGEAGKSGGEGDKPRARTPEPPSGDPTVNKVLNRGILKHRDKLKAFGDNKLDDRLNTAMARMKGTSLEGGLGSGRGTGTGVGDALGGTGTLLRGGNGGPGGGGTAHADIVTSERINTGGVRAPKGVSGGKGVQEAKVSVQTGTPEGDFGDLTAEQILKVVRAHQGAVKYCYEKELQRIPNLAGKIVLNWTIDDTGTVTTSKVGSTTMNNANVEDCLTRQVKKWKFPAPSGGKMAKVRFPFVFNGR